MSPTGSHTMQANRFDNATDARTAILAGNATITLVSKASGARYTFNVKRAKRANSASGKAWFVGLLTGPSNETDYTYAGMLFGDDAAFRLTAKSGVKEGSAPAKAMAWTMAQLAKGGELPSALEVWHEGRCCRCGRKLTVPESIASGIGPECAKKL